MAIALILFCVFQVMPAVSNAAPALSSLPQLAATTTSYMPVSTNMADEEAKHGKRSLNRMPFASKYIGITSRTLEIFPNGTVRGAKEMKPEYGVLKLFTACLMNVTTAPPSLDGDIDLLYGRVSIKGTKSGLYLCMNSTGHVYGSDTCSKECAFKQKPTELHTLYYSLAYKGPSPNQPPLPGKSGKKNKKWYLGIDKTGEMMLGWKAKGNNKRTQFIERPESDFGYNDDRYSSVSTTQPSQKDLIDQKGNITAEEKDEHRNQDIFNLPDTPTTSQKPSRTREKKKKRKKNRRNRNCNDPYNLLRAHGCNKSKRKRHHRNKPDGPFSGPAKRRRHKKVSKNRGHRQTSNAFSFPMR